MLYTDSYLSPLGKITLASNGTNLTGLWIDGQKYYPSLPPSSCTEHPLLIFRQTKEWLDCYFKGKQPDFFPPLHTTGTPFQLAVWNILKQIPYGETVTYKDIANEIARQKQISTMSAQAIGGAVGRNPISIIIPCHRVIGSNKSLTGYAGGIEKKLALLELEGIDTSKLKYPPCHTTIKNPL